MKKQLINDWNLLRLSNGNVFETSVPCSVLETLEKNKEIPNPFIGDNEKTAMKVMEENFEFYTEFDCDEWCFDTDILNLVFEGIDTVSDVYLNDEMILHTQNMHRTFRVDVTKLLKKSKNRLVIRLYSPVKFIKDAYARCESDGSEEAMEGFVHLRKAHYMFGWDWGPHIPDTGIFRPVYIEGIKTASISHVYIHQRHENGKVSILPEIEAQVLGNHIPKYSLFIIDPFLNTREVIFTGEEIPIINPLLWWPNGYGEQNLYEIKINQYVDDVLTDTWSKKIGLRTMEISRNRDEWGESFAHCVNGTDIFAMGADYIPEDNYLGRITPERTRTLLEQCKLANYNAIRVWGGGFFANDEFYDICDELGFVVWQDLMFACGIYELTPEFEENIHYEIRDNLKRISNHACLGLVCGNNEMEMFVNGNLWIKRHSQKADYIKMYEYLFPKWVKEYAPETFYWPSSPSSGGSFDEPNDFNRGDVHYWDVWHNNVPFTDFRNHYFRYLSEFGFQALPSEKTIDTIINNETDKNLFSYCMEKHQRNKSANSKIMQYMQATFLYPSDFKTLIYASQLLSGEAIRYGVEHFRRNRGRCMGTLVWQLNDCWPVISWSSIDYYGRWKALHYFEKRMFSPVLLSCEETGMVSERIDINYEKNEFTPAISLNVSNETTEDKNLIIEWEIRKNSGKVLKEKMLEVTVPKLTAKWICSEKLPNIDVFGDYVSFRAKEGGKTVSEGTCLFSPCKYFRFVNPHLSYEVIGNSIAVKARGFAKNVQIMNEDDDLVLSDNYFDMNPGTRIVDVISGSLKGIQLRSVADIH